MFCVPGWIASVVYPFRASVSPLKVCRLTDSVEFEKQDHP
jgi:hypothetical protein